MAPGGRSSDDDLDGSGRGGDVVGQGPDGDADPSPASWLRRAGVVVAVVAVVVVLTRSGLLSSGEPTAGPTRSPSPSGSESDVATVSGPRLVARVGDRLVLAARGPAHEGAELPSDLGADAALVPVRPGGGTDEEVAVLPGPVVGVHAGQLFRADPARPRYRDLTPADAVVSAGRAPAKALVLRSGALQEVEVSTGSTTDADPYPGFDARRWTARGVLTGPGTAPLLLTRPERSVTGLALAWPRQDVSAGFKPGAERIGTAGEFLGIADDWGLFLAPDCPGDACRLVVVSVIRDAHAARTVAPPAGWRFVAGPVAGQTHEALVPVQGVQSGNLALARLVPGGDNALLVQGTAGVSLAAGLASGGTGRVYLLVQRPAGGQLEARVWDPDAPSAALPLAGGSTFPAGARLVCVCG